jgi:two-component system, response regulator YesN
MKIRLLIAEDEKVERQALQLFIKRAFPDVELLPDAVNGFDLMSKVIEFNPDIVITDIQMPGMNGLDAIWALKKRGFTGKIIIQTAYNQFDYAYDSLKLSVEAFLLKPIKQDVVMETITRVIAKMRTEASDRKEQDENRRIIEQMRPLIEKDIIVSIQLNNIDPDFIELYVQHAGLPSKLLCVMTIQLSQGYRRSDGFCDVLHAGDSGDSSDVPVVQSSGGRSAIEHRTDMETVFAKVREHLSDRKDLIIGPVTNNRLTVLFGSDAESAYRAAVEVMDLSQRMISFFSSDPDLSGNLRIGIGSAVSRLRLVPLSYRESVIALSSMGDRFGIEYYGDINSDAQSSQIFISSEAELLQAIVHADRSRLQSCLSELENHPLILQIDTTELRDTLLSTIIKVVEELGQLLSGTWVKTDHLRHLIDSASKARSREALIAWFSDEISNLFNRYLQANSARVHTCVARAIAYIHDNYMRDISLDLISESIGVSPYHLSHLFRQELDKTYIKYLTEFRIGKVVELVSSGSYSLSELCRLIGYNNPAYFAKVFRRHTGKILREVNHVCRIE